jgi:hypothetical protein
MNSYLTHLSFLQHLKSCMLSSPLSSYPDFPYFKTPSFINNHNLYNNINLKFVKTQQLTFTHHNNNKKSSEISFDFNKNYVFRNLRYTSKNLDNYIESCTLEVGGYKLDEIFGKQFKTLRYIYNTNDQSSIPFNSFINKNYIPQVTFNEIKLFIKLNQEVEDLDISIDVYENVDNIQEFEYKLMRNQFTGTEICHNPHCKFKLDFNNPVSHIIFNVSTGDKPTYTSLYINGIEINIDMEEIECYDGHYIVSMSESINLNDINKHCFDFTKIDNFQLHIKFDNSNDQRDLNIYALSMFGFQVLGTYKIINT